MKISKKNISKIILEELSVLTEKMMIDQISSDLKDKLLQGFSQKEISSLATYELERMIDEIITDKFLSDAGLTHDHEEDILLSTIKKIKS